ncbi:MAG TPA: carotenoid oxygenase family protein [Pyrinomonadaceae bacterium]|nr:carotenoid oxygenase family protein [Pyrinomonadaceae bacterium]
MEDYAPLIERAFSFTPSEQSYTIENIEGDVPQFIRGTYYLNGPACFSRGGFHYNHWLDGDGMVCALRFEEGGVLFTSRFVHSAKYVAEEEAGRPLFRTFGTAFESDVLKRGVMLESPVNVSIYPYAGRLLAFGEQGLPVELDPLTLETHGEFNFHGALNDISPFAAHPKLDHASGEMFNFGIAFGATEPYLNFYRFDANANIVFRKRLAIEYPCSIHDFGLSQNYAVFYLSPYLLDMQAFIRNRQSLLDSLRWEPERGSRLLIVSRETGTRLATIPVGNRYCLHFINCFEQDSRLTIDVVEMDHPIYDQYKVIPNLFTDICEAQPRRFVIDVASEELKNTARIDYLLAPDFPSIAQNRFTQPYQDFWMLGISATGRKGRKFFDQLAHANWACAKACDIYHAPPLHYLGGEPIFIGNPHDEKEGAVICQIFDAQRITSAFAIFDACSVAQGPLAYLRLKEPVHLAFHASFDPAMQTQQVSSGDQS